MNKFLITLFIVWIVWKVIKSAMEELQARMKEQMPQPMDKPAARPPVSPASRAQTAREPDDFEFDEPAFDEEKSDLERWFGEAIERKRQMGKADDAIPLPAGERARPKPPRPRSVQPGAATQRSEPRVERRPEMRAERKRVARPQEPVAVQPQPKRPERAPATPQRPEKAARRARRRERRAMAGLAGIGQLGKRDIRRGIIIAELLGTPKGLRDIDSHVI